MIKNIKDPVLIPKFFASRALVVELRQRTVISLLTTVSLAYAMLTMRSMGCFGYTSTLKFRGPHSILLSEPLKKSLLHKVDKNLTCT